MIENELEQQKNNNYRKKNKTIGKCKYTGTELKQTQASVFMDH
jgi:hypothetical protein